MSHLQRYYITFTVKEHKEPLILKEGSLLAYWEKVDKTSGRKMVSAIVATMHNQRARNILEDAWDNIVSIGYNQRVSDKFYPTHLPVTHLQLVALGLSDKAALPARLEEKCGRKWIAYGETQDGLLCVMEGQLFQRDCVKWEDIKTLDELRCDMIYYTKELDLNECDWTEDPAAWIQSKKIAVYLVDSNFGIPTKLDDFDLEYGENTVLAVREFLEDQFDKARSDRAALFEL